MTIYPDASFLVSWLYKPDPLNVKARVWFARHQADDFLISDWSRFETMWPSWNRSIQISLYRAIKIS